MAMHASPVVASELARTVLVENYFYRVRMEAAKALVVVSEDSVELAEGKYSTSECDYIGLFLLLKLFQCLYCHEVADNQDPLDTDCRPKPNDFSAFPNYFLKKVSLSD